MAVDDHKNRDWLYHRYAADGLDCVVIGRMVGRVSYFAQKKAEAPQWL